MTTIPLTEALERATKGPVKVNPDGKCVLMAGKRSDADVYLDAALLAHCRNELPGLLSALEDALVNVTCYHVNVNTCPICNLRAALLSAQNVKLP